MNLCAFLLFSFQMKWKVKVKSTIVLEVVNLDLHNTHLFAWKLFGGKTYETDG